MFSLSILSISVFILVLLFKQVSVTKFFGFKEDSHLDLFIVLLFGLNLNNSVLKLNRQWTCNRHIEAVVF